MNHKLEKRELEAPDKLTVFFMDIRAFIETHKSRIYVGAGAVALMFLIAGGIYFYQNNYESKAAGLYNDVIAAQQKVGAASPAAEDSAIKGFKELVARYPRSNAALLVRYRLGNIYLSRHDYDNAKTSYNEFIKAASSDNDLVTLAYNALGVCEEQKREFKKALEFYELAMATKTAASFEALNYISAARACEGLKDNKKAVEFYKKALPTTTDPAMTVLIKRKLSILS
jgi:tetratricopeptide (TPR) repeat protein